MKVERKKSHRRRSLCRLHHQFSHKQGSLHLLRSHHHQRQQLQCQIKSFLICGSCRFSRGPSFCLQVRHP
eukprot:9865320-Karenia_brevis.AAC.1